MADHVRWMRNYLHDAFGDFEQLARIHQPPIDFAFSLAKARESTTAQLAERPSHLSVEVVAANFRVTLTYLVMQLHLRAPADFWDTVAETHIFAYVMFCTVDQYADVITHAGPLPGFSAVEVLDRLCSLAHVAEMRKVFTSLYHGIQQQRKNKAVSWRPSKMDCLALMSAHADRVLRQRLQWAAVKAAALVGTVALGAALYWRYKAA